MIPVKRYVDTEHPQMKDKSDYEIWELLNFDARLMVMAEYIGDRVEEAILKLADVINTAVSSKEQNPQ
ncbi:MAG: hypothetical protein DRH51_07835 [Candidatus Coatesbacteria bacterium]|nr:MAG: hypothetical protein DRH51_07835 [Candidatus Coatesbacteria bacterium]